MIFPVCVCYSQSLKSPRFPLARDRVMCHRRGIMEAPPVRPDLLASLCTMILSLISQGASPNEPVGKDPTFGGVQKAADVRKAIAEIESSTDKPELRRIR